MLDKHFSEIENIQKCFMNGQSEARVNVHIVISIHFPVASAPIEATTATARPSLPSRWIDKIHLANCAKCCDVESPVSCCVSRINDRGEESLSIQVFGMSRLECVLNGYESHRCVVQQLYFLWNLRSFTTASPVEISEIKCFSYKYYTYETVMLCYCTFGTIISILSNCSVVVLLAEQLWSIPIFFIIIARIIKIFFVSITVTLDEARKMFCLYR